MSTDHFLLGDGSNRTATAPPDDGDGAVRTTRGQRRLTPTVRAPLSNAKVRKRKGKKRLFFLFAFSLAGVGVALGWWTRDTGNTVDFATLTTKVTSRDFSSSVVATGAVKPQVGAQVRVGARVSGKVEKLRANIGDSVKAGQVIAELEKADLQAIVAQRQAELALADAKYEAVQALRPMEIKQAELELTRWQATSNFARQDWTRVSRLRQTNVATEEEADRVAERVAVADAQVASANKALELARLRYQEDVKQATADSARARHALENALVQLSYATLTAPIGGVIGAVSTQEGETVAAGMNAPIFVTIIDLDRLEVDAMVDEVDIGKVRVGQQAMFTVDSFPAREFPGQVVAIYPDAILLENVVYYNVVIEIQGNEDKVLRPQMTAAATIYLDTKTGVLAVPVKAVKRERGKNVVYVMQDGQPQPREVKVGWKDGTWIEVVSGLEEGEIILQAAPADNATTA